MRQRERPGCDGGRGNDRKAAIEPALRPQHPQKLIHKQHGWFDTQQCGFVNSSWTGWSTFKSLFSTMGGETTRDEHQRTGETQSKGNGLLEISAAFDPTRPNALK